MLKKEKKRAQEALNELDSFGKMPRQMTSASDSDGDKPRSSRPSSASQWNNEKKMTQKEERTKTKICKVAGIIPLYVHLFRFSL